mmetsp:Transcript_31774/g.53593  ORF Transcript_31774/g.53593 Transcript_31774/m.53593 type:complete len:688 (-) Transcript_31774:254-2317(-)
MARVNSHDESPEMTGLLYKKRGGFGKMMPNAWQYRLFILSKSGILTYYDTEAAEHNDIFENKERGRIDLLGTKYTLSSEPQEGAPSNHIIILHPEDSEKWKLCSDTPEDHSRWMKMFEKYSKLYVEREHLRGGSRQSITMGSFSHDDMDAVTRVSNAQSRSGSIDIPSRVDTSAGGDPQISPRSPANTPGGKNMTKAKPGAGGKKGGLRVGKKGDIIDMEWFEFIILASIINVCVFGLTRSYSTWWECGLYLFTLNGVIARTCSLRSYRASKASRLHTTTLEEIGMLKSKVTQLQQQLQLQQQQHRQNSSYSLGTHASSARSRTTSRNDTYFEISSNTNNDNNNNIINVEDMNNGNGLDGDGTTAATAVEGSHSLSDMIAKGFKPEPGCTFLQVDTEPKSSPDHTWCRADHRQFNVRIGPDYSYYKKKAPSAAALYETFAVDVFCTKLRVDHATPRFSLPDTTQLDTHHPFVPPIFVIQIQIPSDPPSGFFSSAEDGPGWAIVMYYRITEDTRSQLENIETASPAVKLFAKWCEKCTEDAAWRGRFKVINSCTNLDELGIPTAISSYNAKPILIRRTGSIFRGPNYMEMNIHVHKFATLAKQSIHYISSRCGQMYMQIGFVIEGREDAELPETLFACVAVNKPQEEQAEFLFDGVEGPGALSASPHDVHAGLNEQLPSSQGSSHVSD